jgi:Lrp/AsnC ligand binding domain
VRAIVRIRLAPRVPCAAFEWRLRATPAVLSAVLVTGDADYELQLDCRGFADLGDVLTRICGWPGVAVESTALVLHEVTGLGQRRPVIADEVTMRRLRTM